MRHPLRHLTLALVAVAMLGACGKKSTPTGPVPQQQQAIKFTFDNDSEGWEFGVTSIDWGQAQWVSKGGAVLELDGVDNTDPEPNAWTWKEIALPASATHLRYKSSAHDRGVGTGFLRVRLKDGASNMVTLMDWEEMSTGSDGFDFVTNTLDISAYAGQTVTLYFELDDIDGGGNNQRYVDDVEILY